MTWLGNGVWVGAAGLFAIVTQLVIFLRWIHRRMRDDEINREFVKNMALIHLPHIYKTLQQLADGLQVRIDEAPPIEFIDFSR